ncbi:hypothetical protein Tco_0714508, partial [Tanacetum coccineum]
VAKRVGGQARAPGKTGNGLKRARAKRAPMG